MYKTENIKSVVKRNPEKNFFAAMAESGAKTTLDYFQVEMLPRPSMQLLHNFDDSDDDGDIDIAVSNLN